MRELTQDVRVFDAHCDGADVYVDVYGGPENMCGSVRFTFPDAKERKRNLALLRRWARDEVSLTLVSTGDTMALVNDMALLRRLGEPA